MFSFLWLWVKFCENTQWPSFIFLSMRAAGTTSVGDILRSMEWELVQNCGLGWELKGLRSKYRFRLIYSPCWPTWSVDAQWKGLRNALAGLFCASLGSLDEQRTTSPNHAFFPQGQLPKWSENVTHELRHASLPSEHVCTENLTPFLKLLPCKSLSGISVLLNPHRVFDADWHGMGVHVLWLGDMGVQLRLTFQSVMDPLRSSNYLSRSQCGEILWCSKLTFPRLVSSVFVRSERREKLSCREFKYYSSQSSWVWSMEPFTASSYWFWLQCDL